MLSKLFSRKPRLDADNPAVRLAALAALDDDEQATFARVFKEDADQEVRLGALARLTRPETILEALGESDVTEQALARLLAIIDDETPEAVRRDPAVLRAALVCAETPDDAIRVASLIVGDVARAEALAENPRANVRQAVTEATWDLRALVELEKSARGHDKSMHRIARDRLATLRAASTRRDEEDTLTEHLLATAVALANDDPHYDARRDAIERDWARHLEAVQATDGVLSRSGIVARDVNAIHRRFPARRPVPKVPEAPVADFDGLLVATQALSESIAGAIATGADENTLAGLKRAADDLANSWNSGADVQPAGDALSARFREAMASANTRIHLVERALALAPEVQAILGDDVLSPHSPQADGIDSFARRVHRQLDDVDHLLGRYAWPEDLPEPEEIAALGQRQRDLAKVAEQSEDRADALVDEVAALIPELRQRIEDGAVHDASEQDRRVRDLVKRLPRAKAQRFNAELAELGSRIRELREWRTYAQAPKREALCQQAEDVADNPLDPHEQMRLIKSLRAQWNELGPVDTRRDRDTKRRFDRAAERAFEPCREYFKEQAERRMFNLEQRRAIVTALEDYVANNDWDHADWRGVEQVLRQARAEWRNYHPVDRKTGRDLAERFEQLADEIHHHLKQEWERNIALKEAIVAEAVQVRESHERVTDQAETMKALQRRWKGVGPVPRRADQRLWKEFREECDAVFEARSVVHDRHSQRRQIIADAEALITELQRRVEIDPSLDRNMIADYERRVHDLGAIPRELERRADEILRDADRIVVARQAEHRPDG